MKLLSLISGGIKRRRLGECAPVYLAAVIHSALKIRTSVLCMLLLFCISPNQVLDKYIEEFFIKFFSEDAKLFLGCKKLSSSSKKCLKDQKNWIYGIIYWALRHNQNHQNWNLANILAWKTTFINGLRYFIHFWKSFCLKLALNLSVLQTLHTTFIFHKILQIT